MARLTLKTKLSEISREATTLIKNMNMPTDQPKIEPYLFFEGRCAEAIEFYVKTLGAKVVMLMHFKDNPDSPACVAGTEDKVMHAIFRIGGSTVMASDGRSSGQANFQGFSLSLNLADEAEANRLFGALADGGQVQMALTKTFFSPRFGMVVDRFGVPWMISVPSTRPFVISRTFNAPRVRVRKGRRAKPLTARTKA